MSQIYKNIKNSASKDFKSYATQEDLPLVGVTDGTIAYVESVKTLYIFDDPAWYGIRLRNDPPTISDAPPERVIIEKFSTYTYDLIAEDPDGLPLTWSYELIEGPTTGYSISFVGSTLSITNNTSGTAIVVKFTASDGTNSATTTTRFVLDHQQGIQGDTLYKTSAINLSQNLGFRRTDRALQWDPSGGLKFRNHASEAHLMNTNLTSTVGWQQATPDTKDISPANQQFVVNGRYFTGGVGAFAERDINNLASSIGSQQVDSRPDINDRTDFGNATFLDVNVVENDIVYIIGYDRSIPIGFDIWAVLVPSSGAVTPLASNLSNKVTDVDPNAALYPVNINVAGDKVLLLARDSNNNGAWFYTFDKNTLNLLGRTQMSLTDFGLGTPSGSYGSTMCQNFFFYSSGSTIGMFDITDPTNVTRVDQTTLPTQFGANSPYNVHLQSERLIVLGNDVSLFDFDCLRGEFTFIDQMSPHQSPIFHLFPSVLQDTTLICGQRDSSYTYVYQIFSTIPSPPAANNVPPQNVTLNRGETWEWEVDGYESNGENIAYSRQNLQGIVPGTSITNADGIAGKYSYTPDTKYYDYSNVQRFILQDASGEITNYDTRFIIDDADGPGSDLTSYLAAEAGTIYGIDHVYNYYGNGTYIKDNIAFCRVADGTIVVENIDNGSTSNAWPTTTVHDGALWYRNSNEIYLFRQSRVYRLSNLQDTTYADGEVHLQSSPNLTSGGSDGHRGYWVESLYYTDRLYYFTHENYLIIFDISDPDNWSVISEGTPSGVVDDNYHAAHSANYVMVAKNSNGSSGTVNPTFFIHKTNDNGDVYPAKTWTFTDVELTNSQTSELCKFEITDDYIFICTTQDAVLASDSVTNAKNTLFVYRINAIINANNVATTLVDTITFPDPVTDIKFKNSTLYLMFTNTTAYVNTYDWDWATETLTIASQNKYVRTGIRGTLGISNDSVFATTAKTSSQTPNLTRFRGA